MLNIVSSQKLMIINTINRMKDLIKFLGNLINHVSGTINAQQAFKARSVYDSF